MAGAGFGDRCEDAVPAIEGGACVTFVLFVGGAWDWMVVKVVVIERTDGAGEEKVLFRSPSVLAPVVPVPAPDVATSEIAVSAVVPNVGALDLGCAEMSYETECLLCEIELCRDC